MSTYKKCFIVCDRCRKEFEEVAGRSPTFMWMQFQSFNGVKEFSNGTTVYNLCVDCEKEFIDWFISGEKNDEIYI